EIVAAFAREDVADAVADDLVVHLAGRDILEAGDLPHAVPGILAGPAYDVQVEEEVALRRAILGETEGVDAGAALDVLVADADGDEVVAALAVDDVVIGGGDVADGDGGGRSPQPVGAVVAGQRVGEGGAGEILDPGQR